MGKCVGYAENTLDYAEISTVHKIDNKVRTTVKLKALQSLYHNLRFLVEYTIFADFVIFLIFLW